MAPDVTPRPVRALDRPPSLLSSYARAARQRPGRADAVPEQVLRLAGVVPETSRVAAYAQVCGDRLGPDLPPLYPHMLGFPLQMALLTDHHSPVRAMGLVHVRNDVVVSRGIPLGSPLDLEVEMRPPRPHRKGRTVDLVARALVDGEVVWHSVSTYLSRGKPSGEAGGAEGAADAERGAGGAPEPDLRPSAQWRLPGDLGRQYAAVSGDRNPIHMSPLTARAFGFPRAIIHGMWTAARCLAALEGRLDAPYRTVVEFRSPILLPGTVEFWSGLAPDRTAFAVRARGKDRVHLTGEVTPA